LSIRIDAMQSNKEVEHESNQGNRSLPGLPSAELPKKYVPDLWSILSKFRDQFSDRVAESISSEEILAFLAGLNDGCKQLTRHTRYSYLKASFNFIRNNLNALIQNPCDTPMLKKLFRPGKLARWQIHEKETIDEIIFRTTKVRNRLMLELMARGGMRAGEVLKLNTADVDDQKLTIRNPKSGKTSEVVFIPSRECRS
jgi:integrase/recombinase XerD